MKKLASLLLCLLPMMAIAQESANKDDVVFVICEIMPEFPGGPTAYYRFVRENLRYPASIKEKGIEGKVICQSVIGRDGLIEDVQIAVSSGETLLDEEAVRLIKTMPRFFPGMQRGEPVRVKYTLPITFSLSGDQKPIAADEEAERKIIERQQRTHSRSMGKFHHGDRFDVQAEESSSIIRAANGVMICPNQGFVEDKKSAFQKDYYGKVSMQGDTMFVHYYSSDKDQLYKKEHYLYNAETKGLTLDGEQLYYYANKPICGEIISNGKLKRAIWYDLDGNKERIYVIRGNDIMEMQLYPSGKSKLRTEHFGTPNAVQTAYDEEGNEVAPTQPVFQPNDMDELEGAIRNILLKSKVYLNSNYQLLITTVPESKQVSIVYCDEHSNRWNASMMDVPYEPARIADQPVTMTIYKQIEYRPFELLIPTVADSLTTQVFCHQEIKKTFEGIWQHTRYFTITDSSAVNRLTAVIHRDADTLFMTCYSNEEGDKTSGTVGGGVLVAKQKLVSRDAKIEMEGWQEYYKNGQLDYMELFHADTLALFRKYTSEGILHHEVIPRDKENYMYKEKLFFYPSGELKIRETTLNADNSLNVFYTKVGKNAVGIFPSYSNKMNNKTLLKYIQTHLKEIKNYEKFLIGGWMNLNIEVSETGQIADVQINKYSLSTSMNINRDDLRNILDQIAEIVRQSQIVFTPGTIDGEPQTLPIIVHLTDVTLKK